MPKPTMARQFRRESYLRIANALKSSKPVLGFSPFGGNAYNDGRNAQWTMDCNAIADMLADQSEGFDKALFLRNCGVQS